MVAVISVAARPAVVALAPAIRRGAFRFEVWLRWKQHTAGRTVTTRQRAPDRCVEHRDGFLTPPRGAVPTHEAAFVGHAVAAAVLVSRAGLAVVSTLDLRRLHTGSG